MSLGRHGFSRYRYEPQTIEGPAIHYSHFAAHLSNSAIDSRAPFGVHSSVLGILGK
jgi:hypothetical protein